MTVACEIPAEGSGKATKLELADGGVYKLSKANNYRVTLDDIYAGAVCTIVETDRGGADKTVMDPVDGKVTIGDGESVKVTITNTFTALPKTGASVFGVLAIALALGAAGYGLTRATRGKGTRRA